MSQILRVGFQQATRSLILILLPVAFIALVVWATAGSSSGNTADPLRAAFWIFLVAHQVPLQLSLSDSTIAGTFTYLPIGALLIPFFATKSGYARLVEILGEPKGKQRRDYILAYALNYSVIGYLISLPALGGTVKAPFYFAIPMIFTVVLVSAFLVSGIFPKHGLQFPWQRALRAVWILLMALLGVSALVLAISMIYHFDVVLDLTRVVEPGIFGGLVLLVGQILYLPNLAAATLSFFSGAGISIGAGSLLSPFTHRIDEIPAIPILGALPAQSSPLLALFALVIIALGGAIAGYGIKNYQDPIQLKNFYIASVAISALLLLIIARVTSGQLLSENLPSVGPIWWAMPLVITLELLVGGMLYIYVPRLATRIRS